jgi:glutamate synthase domain-containing protein 2
MGGVLPAAKVTKEIAVARGVLAGQKCVSPPVFGTPRGLLL